MTFQCGVALSMAVAVAGAGIGARVDVAASGPAAEATPVADAATSLDFVPIARLSAEKRELYVVVDRANAQFSVAECAGGSPKVADGGCALLIDVWRPTTPSNANAFDRALADATAAHDKIAGADWSLGGSIWNFAWSEFIGIGTGVLLGGTPFIGPGISLGGVIFLSKEFYDYRWRANRSVNGEWVRFERRRDGSIGVKPLADRRSVSRENYLAMRQALTTALGTRSLP